jgi:hypothetical protein
MKRILLFFIVIVTVNMGAQSQNALKRQTDSVVIDSLRMALKKLQHDYDYLDTTTQLKQLKQDIANLNINIQIKSNELKMHCYHSPYNSAICAQFEKYYRAAINSGKSSKELYDMLKTKFVLKMIESNFTEVEIDLLRALCDTIDSEFSLLDSNLDYYNTVLGLYKDKW